MIFQIHHTNNNTRIVLVCTATGAAKSDRRLFRAQTYELASSVEMASVGESWEVCVAFESDTRASIILKLVSAEEAEVADMVLEVVVEMAGEAEEAA